MKNITSKGKVIIQYILLLLLIGITTYIVSTTLDVSLIPKLIKVVDKKYIVLGVLVMATYILFESIILSLIVNLISKTKVKFLGFKLATMGMYYNLVTPFASGSQPIQIYTLTKYNISLSKAMAIITNKTVIFQSTVTIYSAYLIYKNYDLLKLEMDAVLTFVTMGMTMNVSMLVGGLLIVLSPSKTKYLVRKIIKVLSKFKIFNFITKRENEALKLIDEYSYSLKLFMKNIRVMIVTIILTIVQLTLFFSVIYCVYKAFRLSGASYTELLTLQVFLYMAVSPVPTPGNVGANEIAFMTIFADIFSKEIMGYSVFLYSGLVYYLVILICGIITVHTHYKMGKDRRIKKNIRLKI